LLGGAGTAACGDTIESHREMLKNPRDGIFKLAASQYTPAMRSLDQWLTPLIQAGASCPGREALNKSALPLSKRTAAI
jgi:hypothetical protein